MLNKEDILNILKQYNFDSSKYVVISGAALVLRGIKETTTDIDIAVTDDLYTQLLQEYNCTFEKNAGGGYKVWFINNIINFSNHYYDTIDYEEYLGYKVQKVESILKLKKELNRDKDKLDIEKIESI